MKKKTIFHYGDGVLTLPRTLLDSLGAADEIKLKILLHLAADPTTEPDTLSETLGCTVATVQNALAFWSKAGILDTTTAKPARKPPRPPVQEAPALQVADSAAAIPPKTTAVPHYSTEELNAAMERRRGLSALLDECANIFGKIFSRHETGVLLGLVDYLNLEDDYLLTLLAHCAAIGKRSIRYVESLAISLYDEGVTDTEALIVCLKKKEEALEMQGKVRALFGLGSRALTAKEKNFITTWLDTYHYDMDIVTLAYEATVNATGGASLAYAASILDRWYTAGIKTPADVAADAAARAARGKSPAKAGDSFDTDDFFGAALERSFGESFAPATTTRPPKSNKKP